ncbi:MAG TPA: LuxR C-terminal-related transcriptional regulator [Bacillales bacterium]|nr:LuxR C-terminal-related transcriptional regulator [Bacillales bacterium]
MKKEFLQPGPFERAKLTVPPQNGRRLIRTSFHDLLKNQEGDSFISVIAPFGYGKTTLFNEVAHALMKQHAVGWLTLDERENDPIVFLRSLTLACPQIDVSRMEQVFSDARNHDADFHTIIEQLLELVQNNPEPSYMFIDQYDRITNHSIHELFSLFLKYVGSRFFFYIASRIDLPFSNEIRSAKPFSTEITYRQLKFDTSEIQALIEQETSIQLPPAEIKEIEKKTEGWPFAIHRYCQLLNRSRQIPYDAQLTLDELQQEMNDLFIDRLFSSCPPELQHMILALSVPESFNTDLALFLTGQEEAKDLLNHLQSYEIELSRDVDGNNRFHPMIRESLKKHFQQLDLQRFQAIHRKCSQWFEENHHLLRAVEHSVEIDDYDRAAQIIMKNAFDFFKSPWHVKEQLVECVPYHEVIKEPAVSMVFAWFLISMHRLSTAERLLNQTEPYLNSNNETFPPTGESITGYIATIRSRMAFLRRDTEGGLKYMKEGMALLGNRAYLYSHSNTLNVNGSSLLKSVVGHWGAIDQCIAMCQLSKNTWGGINQGFGLMTILLGECYFERNERTQAETHLNEGRRIGLDLKDSALFLSASISLIQLKWCMKQYTSCHILMEDTLKIVEAHHSEGIDTFTACQARIAMKEQDTNTIKRWLETCTLTVDPPLDLKRLFEYVTLLKAYLFFDLAQKGMLLGEKLLQLAQTWHLPYFIAEVHLLLSAFYEKSEEEKTALYHMEKALEIGEREGYRQLFLMEWEAMDLLLPKINRRIQLRKQTLSPQVEQFLKELTHEQLEAEIAMDPLLLAREKLSNQEYNVLKFLIDGKSNRYISDHMFITVETVKSHCKNIYKKLNLKSRKEVRLQFEEN